MKGYLQIGRLTVVTTRFEALVRTILVRARDALMHENNLTNVDAIHMQELQGFEVT